MSSGARAWENGRMKGEERNMGGWKYGRPKNCVVAISIQGCCRYENQSYAVLTVNDLKKSPSE